MKIQDVVDQITTLKAQLLRFGVQAVTSLSRPAAPGLGQVVYEGDTGKLKVYNGTEWNACSAGGQLGHAFVTTNQTGLGTPVDLSGLSVTVTVGTNRRIKITMEVDLENSTNAIIRRIDIKEGSTALKSAQLVTGLANTGETHHGEHVFTPTAGIHTYKLTYVHSGGVGQLDATTVNPAFILVEDIGPA